jgi:hypothetical protein
MSEKTKNIFGYIGGAIISLLIIFTHPPLSSFLMLILWVAFFAYFYRRWKQYYFPLDKDQLKVLGGVIIIEIIQILLKLKIIYLAKGISSSIFILDIILLLIFLYHLIWDDIKNPPKAVSEATDDQLIYSYVNWAKIWGDGLNSDEDETEKIRKAEMYCWLTYSELRKRESAILKLVPLLNHKHDGVRALASRHLLWDEEKRAKENLEKVSLKKGQLGEAAAVWLKEWNEGKIPREPQFWGSA